MNFLLYIICMWVLEEYFSEVPLRLGHMSHLFLWYVYADVSASYAFELSYIPGHVCDL